MESPTIARAWLQAEFNRRRTKNRAYSLRAFALSLDVPSGRLSEILSNRRSMTFKLAEKIADRIGFPPNVRRQFLATVPESGSKRREPKEDHSYEQLSDDAFHVISDWYHFALMSLIETRDFRSDVRWIARRFGISVMEVRSAIERLERLRLVAVENGQIKRLAGNVATTQDVSSAALRSSHRQSLEQAIESLDQVSIELRDISSITMAIDTSRLPEAKKPIRSFRRRLCGFLEQGNQTEVYNLNVQLYPVTQTLEKTPEKKVQ